MTLSGQDVVTFIIVIAAPIGLTLVCVGLRGIFAHQEYLGIGWQMKSLRRFCRSAVLIVITW